ncbi:MAG: nuclear transport factor 2 family protein [Idiomarina sp.]|nr:nuclear transport factor 2 family protein [Idiomarina sp.]
MSMSSQDDVIQSLKSFYAKMEDANVDELSRVYADNVAFSDPVHRVDGLPALKTYLANSIKNVSCCHFDFTHQLLNSEGGYLTWQMRFAHPKIQRGEEVVVPGVTQLKFTADGARILEHTDYYDMGAMVYEHVPVMGWLTNQVKSRMKN